MLTRQVVKEFLDSEFEDLDLKMPKDIPMDGLVGAFYQYVQDTYDEGDYYERLKEHFESFFNHGNPDWERIRERLTANEEQRGC